MQNRYLSLDAFRGFTVALMILVNNPGSYSSIFWPLDHAKWDGCTLTDLVFPFFLFAVGNAAAFVLPKQKGTDAVSYLNKIFKRSIFIFLVGLFLNWFPFFKWESDTLIFKIWENVRILGVLQRIAICYLISALIIYFFNEKRLFYIGAFLLILYWFLCFYLGGSLPYSMEGFVGTRFDSMILGQSHMYMGEGTPFEPEGLFSSIGAISQVIIGYLVGLLIINKGRSYEMLSDLFFVGVVLVIIGLTWNLSFPVNKKIWSSSYTILTSGMAILILASFIYIIEFKALKKIWVTFLEPFGKNPLFIFVLSGVIPRLLGLIRIHAMDENGKTVFISPLKWLYENAFKNLFVDLRVGSLLYAVFFITVFWVIAYCLDKKKIYIKL